jgi:GNAT superfamily N-acetyltransferase
MTAAPATFTVLRDASAAFVFRFHTFPAFRHLLDFPADVPAPIAIAASVEDTGAGLGLAMPVAGGNQAELLSLYVTADARRRGIAGGLLRGIERECLSRGISSVKGTYMTGQANTEAVEHLLQNHHFGKPETRMLVVRCTSQSIAPAPWMRERKLPSGYEVLSWVDLTAAERAEILESNAKEAWIATDLVPFNFEAGAEPVTSVALRVRGQIRGWCLNHVVGGVLRFTCSFVHPDLQRLGRVLWLYREAVARAPRAGLNEGMWTIPVWHPGMVRFAQRWMQPYSIFFGETRGFAKQLSRQSAAVAGTQAA